MVQITTSDSNLMQQLEEDGIVRLRNLFNDEQLKGMQEAFAARLKRLHWNNIDRHEITERYRHMIEDVLTMNQGFLDVAIHDTVKALLRRYVGEEFVLTEARGWHSLITKNNFHGWHGDACYDQQVVEHIPREVKLFVCLSDVTFGDFTYIRSSHRQHRPRYFSNDEIRNCSSRDFIEVRGLAGSACLFDTTAIHRHGVPIREMPYSTNTTTPQSR